MIKLDLFDMVRNLQAASDERRPVLAIYEKTSKFLGKGPENDYRRHSAQLNYGLFKPAKDISVKHPSKPSNDTKIENEIKKELKQEKKITHKV
jgi:hypothetical protein